MTIKPLKSYKAPAYPTFEESKMDAQLLKRLPRRWGKNSPIASLLGTGIIIQIAGAGRGDDGAVKVNVQIVAPAEPLPKAVADAVRALPATRVAPILEDALANDGRGGFGCVAISAPVFLSENEAIDLIEAELKKTGLQWKDMVSVDGLKIPAASAKRDLMGGREDREDTRKLQVKTLVEGTYTFDLGTEDRSVVVKFLQMKDFDLWNDNRNMSTWQSFDFASLASEISDTFKQRANGKPVIIGIFFEPSTYPEKKEREKRPEQGKVDLDKIREQVRTDYEKIRQETKERAKEKLRQQVQHFVDYLKQEGVVTE